MARGGYIAPDLAVNRLFAVLKSRAEARGIITDALVAGTIHALGRRRIYPEESDINENESETDGESKGPMILKDISTWCPTYSLGDVEEIKPYKWKWTYQSTPEKWSWVDARFIQDGEDDEPAYFDEVRFHEKDINALVAKQKQLVGGNPLPVALPKERRRHSAWNDWVAAAVACGFEQQIEASMGVPALLSRINAKLQKWGFEEMAESTVYPPAMAILKHFASHPPVAPIIPSAQKP